ncbi:cubilin homolog isoform X1 [Aedes albopictus]|uniref:Cubilin n=1 Tax=Aedes albopictus TaxID=7160 RepID=A0ABM1YV09_AEDAL
MENKVILLVLLNFLVQVYCYYENQPKLLTNDGHLIIESAVDRNITVLLKGNSFFNVGDVSLGKLLHGLANVSSSSSSSSVPSDSSLPNGSSQLQFLMNVVSGPFGLQKRIAALENGTSDTGEGRGRGRINNINRRLTVLERKVGNVLSKLRENNCKTSPCQNGGTCISLFDSFVCLCPKNWEGPTCANDVNECSEFAGTDLGCQNGATCKNTPGGYSCICANGWQGIHCNSKTKDCLTSGSELCGHGTCVQTKEEPGYKCICDQGWKNNGVMPACSVDVDECAESKPHCSKDPEVSCINLPGSFVCGSCPAGYTGNGFYCVDIDECQTNNGGCSTSPAVTCINLRGSSKCGNCPLGYMGDGQTCTLRGNRCTPGLCHPLARCMDYSGGVVSCICPPGYQGSGYGSTGCIRMPMNPCTFNPCKNGGTCISNGNNYTCTCPPGTAQPNCARLISPCAINPCMHGGTCTPFIDRYVCTCPSGYTGMRCQSVQRACGGVLDVLSGSLTYPIGNGTYNHNARCAWLIITNHTKILNVTFTKFNLENPLQNKECKYDWLQIHDGKTSAAHNIGRFCGNTLPMGGNILSTHNFLYLWFRTDNSTAHDGFALHWDSIDPICGGELSVKSHGVIASPGSPGKYPPNRDCKWFLSAPPGKRLQFHFFTMQLEAHDSCEYDFVQISDGLQEEAPVLKKYCNTSHPEPLVTPGNEATVYFHSDEDGTDSGFQISYSVIEGIPGCGGVFTKTEGEISSPRRYEDNKYPNNLICEYLINLPQGSRINVQFNRFHLESSETCKFDYVEMFDGRTVDDPSFGRFCGERAPPQFRTNSNSLLVKFHSDWSQSQGGFSLTYKLLCGGVYTDPSVEITSPGYPKTYGLNQRCDYVIEAPLGKAVLLDFQDFDVEGNSYPNCDLDFVEIYDGLEASNSSFIGRYCSSKIPPRAISSLNVMLMRFVSDASIGGKGFKANFTFVNVTCGGVITSEDFTIRPPSMTDQESYMPDSDCRWVIVAPKTHAIQLTWNSFELEKSSNCVYDFVEIYDNSSVSNPLVGRYCGTTKPPALTSSGNVVTIRFKSDSSSSKDGFSLSFLFRDVSKLCDGNFFTSTGVIKSPNYPQEYPSNKICEWVITVPLGQQIELNVKNFTMEKHTACRFDGLEIRNGGTSSAPLIGKFCGTDDFNGTISFSNKIYLKFYSDASRNYGGFYIEWDGTSTGCGGVLTSPRGSIISPNYPESYGNNAQCGWRITVSAGSAIHIVFIDIDMESVANCRYDHLEVFDGRDVAGKSLGKFCTVDTDPIQLNTEDNHAFIKMRSDDTNQGRGFHLKYNILCKRNITGFGGVIESPNFPDKYPGSSDCLWTINVPLGNKIDIEFSHFELENGMIFNSDQSHVCHFDYVEISEPNDEQNVPKKYCNHMPASMTSKGSTVQIGFKSDTSGESIGFRLEWQLNGCGGILTRPFGSFNTPNYPNEYPTNTHCLWTIAVVPGSVIELTVSNFNMETSSSCRYDGLTISNTEDFDQIIGTFCHTQKEPVKLTSSGHILYVKFYSDQTYTYKGFTAYYRTVPAQCGGLLTTHQGFLYSPNYPKNYPGNQSCEWIIQAEPAYTLKFNLEDIGIVSSPNCSQDYLQVFDGMLRDERKLLMKVCDSEANVTSVMSRSNQLLVTFNSDAAFEAKGFRANYSINCGGRINVTHDGIISLENTHRIKSENCTWILVADQPMQHITLQVMHMNIVEVEGSCLANLTIHDGEDINAPVRFTGCGSKTPPAIVSNGYSLTVHITSDDYNLFSLLGMQFIASYSVLNNACGGELTSFSGEFASPHYPNRYPMNVQCIWAIKASPGNTVQLYFRELDLFESEDCNVDYLEIRETSGSGKLIGDFCGKNLPGNLTSSNSFWIKLQTGNQGFAKGFLAEFSYDMFSELTGSSGVVTSPMFPRDYARNEIHTWRIMVDIGSVISMKFTAFEIDAKFVDTCEGQLEIYDGFDDTAEPLKGELCGLTPPEPFKSSSNVVFIRLDHSDASGPSKFSLSWEQIGKEDQTPASTDTDDQFCGGPHVIVLSENATTYNLTSPGYPIGYRVNLNCSWVFQSASQTEHAFLQLTYVDLEETDACLSDYLEISTSSDMISWSKAERICTFGYRVKSMFHGKPFLKVDFRSDYYANRTGFTGIASLRCGGVMTESNGVIEIKDTQSYNETARFLDSVCMWNITVRPGRTIEFQFESIKLQKTEACDATVSIKNGIDEYSPLLGSYCGNEIPGKVNTSSNRAFVKFNSGHITTNQFKLTYREVGMECGGRIILRKNNSPMTLTTPNFPEMPHPHSECIWTIMAPAGETIKYEFKPFMLKYSHNCVNEYVEVRDGGTTSSSVLLRACTQENVPSRLTTSNMLRVRYFTDSSDPGNGFKLNVSIAKCGGSIHTRKGTVQSKNYPILGGYPFKSVCEYFISGSMNTVLNLTFMDINLPTATNCSSDNLKIYSVLPGENVTELLIGTYCGSQIPTSVLTYGNQAKLVFTTFAMQSSYRGFKIGFSSVEDQCGGEVNSAAGDITSPGYPDGGGLRFRRFCEWRITVPEGRRVKAEFIDLDLSTVSASYMQRIGFYHGFDYSARIRFVTGGSYNNKPIYSSNNKMMINFWSRISSDNKGFKIHFSSDEPSMCVGNLDGDEGMIATPINQTSFMCEYRRSSGVFSVGPAGRKTGTMALYFSEMKAGMYNNACALSTRGIFILRGAIVGGQPGVLKKYCGNATNSDLIRSPFPDMYILARQGLFLGDVRFKLRYQIHQCGGMFGSELKNISSSNLAKNTGPVDCAWYVDYPENTLINIEFANFNLNDSCDNEYLSIYNGPTTNSPLLGKFCKGSGVETIITQDRYAFIEYHSENANLRGDFEMKLAEMTSGCGGTLHKNTATFGSPNLGGKYAPNMECIWTIRADIGYHVGISFINRFNLEKSENCSKDYLEFFDRINDSWTSVGRVCGKNTPKMFNSTGSLMRVIFRTDSSVEGDGFTIKWEQNCGGIYTVDQNTGVMMSPNYPMNYDRMVTCNYTFVANDQNSYVNLNFIDFALEDGPQTSICIYDNITLYKPMDYQTPLQWEKVGTYCKQNSPGRIRFKGRVAVVFRSDRWLESRGFKFEYKLDSCGGSITQSTRIASPETNTKISGYGNSLYCTWNITIPDGKKVIVRFEDFELEHSDGCYFDNVEIYKGLEKKPDQKMASLCGNLTAHAPAISIKGTHGVVYYKSEQFTSNSHHFSALVLFVNDCDLQVTLEPNSQPYNLNMQNNDPAMRDCQYTFKAPPGYSLRLTFNKFLLGSSRNSTGCSDNFVEARDGGGPFADLIGKYCGYALPVPATTYSESLFMRMVTDSTGQGSGFNATISLVETPCGRSYYNLSEGQVEVVQSPNYGKGTYPSNTRCLWRLEVPAGKTINVEFNDFKLQNYSDDLEKCPDKLEFFDASVKTFIYEGLGEDVIFRGKSSHAQKSSFYHGTRNPNSHHIYCGSGGLPVTYHSHSSKLYVKFESDERVQDVGFRLSIQQNNYCGQNYTRLQGRINSNYVVRKEHCTITIQVPENYTLALYFAIFYTHAPDCEKEGIRIYDGLGTDKQLELLCSYSTPNPVFSESNALRIEMPPSQAEHVSTMIDASYLATDQGRGCGGEMFNYGGIFSSPLYPNNNRTRKQCLWTVTVPNNMRIALKFDTFDMGSITTCSTDYVELIEVKGAEKRTVRKHCGGDQPSTYISENSVMQVLHKQTQNFGGTGWLVKYMAIEKDALVNNW